MNEHSSPRIPGGVSADHTADEPADGTAHVQTVCPGEVLGWSWMFPPFVWHLQARSIEPTHAIAFNAAHLLVAAERDDTFVHELMKRISQVLIHRLQAARKELLAAKAEAMAEA